MCFTYKHIITKEKLFRNNFYENKDFLNFPAHKHHKHMKKREPHRLSIEKTNRLKPPFPLVHPRMLELVKNGKPPSSAVIVDDIRHYVVELHTTVLAERKAGRLKDEIEDFGVERVFFCEPIHPLTVVARTRESINLRLDCADV